MPTVNRLYKRRYPINEQIGIVVPTVGEILEDEDEYYSLVASLTAMPIDMMVALDDAGIDFTTINEYELFLLMFQGLQQRDTRLIFGDLDLTKFRMDVNQENGMVVLRDAENGITIDRAIHGRIADELRKLHHLEKNNRKPGNKEAMKYMIEKERRKLKRHRNKKERSQLETLIVALVNTEQFKYDYSSVLDLSIYQFNESVRQVIKKIDVEHRMTGIYFGTVSAKDMKRDDLNWLVH